MELTADTFYHQHYWIYDRPDTFYAGLFNAKHCPVFAHVNQPTAHLIFGLFVSLRPCTVLGDLTIRKSENDHC